MLPLPVQAVLLYRILRDVVPCLYLIDLDRLLVLAVTKPPGGLTALARRVDAGGERRHLDHC